MNNEQEQQIIDEIEKINLRLDAVSAQKADWFSVIPLHIILIIVILSYFATSILIDFSLSRLDAKIDRLEVKIEEQKALIAKVELENFKIKNQIK